MTRSTQLDQSQRRKNFVVTIEMSQTLLEATVTLFRPIGKHQRSCKPSFYPQTHFLTSTPQLQVEI